MKYSLWVLQSFGRTLYAIYDNEKGVRNACDTDIDCCLDMAENQFSDRYILRREAAVLYPIEEISHSYILSTYPELFI